MRVPCNPTIVQSPEWSPPPTPTSVAEFPLSSRESRLSVEEITLVGEMRENRVLFVHCTGTPPYRMIEGMFMYIYVALISDYLLC